MRKYHQKLILELLVTLLETTNEAQRLSSTNLLADCQEVAIEIGSLIEQLEGESHVIVKYLEEYCELLYQASLKINETIDNQSVFNKLHKLLITISNSVKYEVKIELEVLFLPYKASMWDSLESIWSAAKNDPGSDVYVVPIPFYEKNADGTSGQVHYEGGEFPDYVPIVNWKSYNIAERYPDIIFIHNPYDNSNYVTSVYPDYYSEKLRNFTGMLVYCPYFVTGDEIEEHFLVLPGTIYSHRIITQSNVIKKEYLKKYILFEKENNCIGMFGRADDKFLALGSPKFDAVLNKRRNEFSIPDEWKTLIKKADGSTKKIVLYNTTIAGLLNGDEKVLNKLRHVFNCFKNNQEIVLLWRPHPMSISTCKSMRPKLLSEYLDIVKAYKKEAYGIYDDSSDLHRAITVSDGYYGDLSSLVFMYGITGKPIIIQDIENLNKTKTISTTELSNNVNGNVWGFDRFSDGLYKMDFENDIAELVVFSDDMPQMAGRDYNGIRYQKTHCIGDNIICIPFHLNKLLVYNNLTKKDTRISLANEYSSDVDGSFGLFLTVNYNEKIYCFGAFCKAIVVFDINSFEVEYHTIIFEQIGLYIDTGEYVKYPLYISECDEDGKITIIMRDFHYIIRYSLLTQEIEYLSLNPLPPKCILATINENIVWMISINYDKLIMYNTKTNETREYLIPFDRINYTDKKYIFGNISAFENYLLLFPNTSDTILRFDMESRNFSEYSMPVSDNYKENNYKWFEVRHQGNMVLAYSYFNQTLYEMDKISGEVKPHKFALNKQSAKKYFKNFLEDKEDIVFEHDLGNVADFFVAAIDGINEKRKNRFLEYSANKNGTAGQIIYERIRKEVLG